MFCRKIGWRLKLHLDRGYVAYIGFLDFRKTNILFGQVQPSEEGWGSSSLHFVKIRSDLKYIK